jgi:3',5'-cyclic AMP phosphodiesterase CpdA
MEALTGRTRFTRAGYDGYLVTGDIATTGTASDMLAAANVLRRVQGHPGTETLDDSAAPLPGEKVVLLPGNHDRYLGRGLMPRSAHFEHGQNFGANWTLDDPTHAEKRSEVNHKVLTASDGTQLAVVTGDFSFLHPSPRYLKMLGGGRARQSTLDHMCDLTNSHTSRSVAVVWAVHFPPVKRGVKRHLRLERHEEVIRAASKVGVETIFCGHTHEAKPIMPAFYGDKITGIKVVCAGSACEYVRPGRKDRSYFEVQLAVLRGRARLIARPVEMIYSVWQERLQQDGQYGNGAEFCPAP